MRCPHCGESLTLYKNPAPTVDIIIEVEGGIVLIERANPPHGWALPGGFVDYGESCEQAALREAKEETDLSVTLLRQLGCYSDPARDARQHTISTVYVARASGHPQGMDDARQAKVFSLDALPSLVFDHARIIEDYCRGSYTLPSSLAAPPGAPGGANNQNSKWRDAGTGHKNRQ